jgi:hypothetical protein
MYAIEFEADLKDGTLKIPDAYKSLTDQHVRVVMLLERQSGDPELRAMSNHSAVRVEEWCDKTEDEVWK